MKENNNEVTNNDTKKAQVKKSMGQEIWEWTYSILLAVVIALLIKNFIFSTTIVKGESMVPTLQENNMLIIDRLSQVRGIVPKRGDVITIEAPIKSIEAKKLAEYEEVNGWFNKLVHSFTKTLYVKRVIALPGDHLVVDGDKIYVNDELLKEDYINKDSKVIYKRYYDIDMIIPDGYIMVMGDNRDNSLDGRTFGAVPIKKIEGKAIFRFWPFTKFGTLK